MKLIRGGLAAAGFWRPFGFALTLFLTTAQPAVTQQDPPTVEDTSMQRALDQARARARWRAHVTARDRRLAAGDVGSVTVTIPMPGGATKGPVVVRLIEPLPAAVRPRGSVCVTDNFLAIGTARDGTWTAERVPTGLNLVLEVEPVDRSAPTARYPVTGPIRRGQDVEVEAPLASPYPVLTGRVVNAAGGPFGGRQVSIEVRIGGQCALSEITTDADGRFQAAARVTARPGSTGTVTVVPGKLRHGSGRLSITSMPVGPTARAHVQMPRTTERPRGERPAIVLGDLGLRADR